MIMKKQHSKSIARLCCRGLLLVTPLLMFGSMAHADGGFVELHQESGQFLVTVFTSPGPLRVGPIDISVLVQDRSNGQPLLDGEVSVQLSKEGEMTLAERATREVAQNKLLYSALVHLPEAGQWEMEVTIKQGKETARILGQVSATASPPFLLSYWRGLSLPPIIVAAFALNQWSKRRTAQRRNAAL